MCYWLHQGVKVKLLPSVWKHNVNKETVLTVLTVLLSFRGSCTGACAIWACVDKHWLLLRRAVNIQLYSKHLQTLAQQRSRLSFDKVTWWYTRSAKNCYLCCAVLTCVSVSNTTHSQNLAYSVPKTKLSNVTKISFLLRRKSLHSWLFASCIQTEDVQTRQNIMAVVETHTKQPSKHSEHSQQHLPYWSEETQWSQVASLQV